MKKHFQIRTPDTQTVLNICNTINCTPVTATILINRNIVSEKALTSFFNPSLNEILPQNPLKDMDVAVERIARAITNHEKILIFGDYDVDGITSTTLLYEFLNHVNANVSFYIPHRIKEGYSLQVGHILNYATPENINLIITTDCGSSSHDAVNKAQNSGIDVVITDHHNISDSLPPAVAVVNPKRSDCCSGLENLAGVGVAFYMLIALRKHLRDICFWKNQKEPNLKNMCDLVALGTLADSVPITGVNRTLTKTGLEIISSGKRPGIKALAQICKISTHDIDSGDIAFKLAPRLNAAGRIGHSKQAVTLLTAKDPATAMQIAQSLNEMNITRQNIEKKILNEISLDLQHHPHLLKKKSIVLADNNWHEGVNGIVAARLAETYCRPAILISTSNGMGKGSARSIPGFDLFNGLLSCADDLESFGGHTMAAGLKIKTKNIDRFKENFEAIVLKKMKPDDFTPKLFIDVELDLDDISPRLIDEIEYIQPFGTENQEPLFLARNVHVISSAPVGTNHRKMCLSHRDGIINAIQFNIDVNKPLKKRFDQMVFHIGWNRWNKKKQPQIIIKEI